VSATSSIEWTDATWNPVRGCSIVSKGCTNCYAMRQAHRFSGAGKAYEGLTQMSKGGPVWTGNVRLVPELLDEPLHWKKRRRIFVNSMSDLFHEDVPDEFIDRIWRMMMRAKNHTFQILTKRPARMLAYLSRFRPDGDGWITRDGKPAMGKPQSGPLFSANKWPPKHIWLGVSCEDQPTADERIPLLLQMPAAVRWISAEPLLGDIVVPSLHELDWVVAGGESGPGARPMHPRWVGRLRDECAVANVPFFFKQWGAWAPVPRRENAPGKPQMVVGGDCMLTCDGRSEILKWPLHSSLEAEATPLRRFGKKRAGRLLDGRTHDEYPA